MLVLALSDTSSMATIPLTHTRTHTPARLHRMHNKKRWIIGADVGVYGCGSRSRKGCTEMDDREHPHSSVGLELGLEWWFVCVQTPEIGLYLGGGGAFCASKRFNCAGQMSCHRRKEIRQQFSGRNRINKCLHQPIEQTVNNYNAFPCQWR